MTIKEHQTFEAKNLLVCEGTYYHDELNALIERMKEEIKKHGAQKAGATISATLAIYRDSPRMDILIMIPLDRRIELESGEFRFEPEFKLTNAITIRHSGHPEGLSEAATAIMEYIQENNLQPSTTGYNVATKEAGGVDELDDMIVDIYVDIQ
jgi:effector-binding domain-containing protein